MLAATGRCDAFLKTEGGGEYGGIQVQERELGQDEINVNEIDVNKEIGYNINQNLGAVHRISEWTGGQLWKAISGETVIWSS